MKSKPAPVKRWEQQVADYGCVVTREPQVQIHHVKGRTFKHDKVLIGPWYILPLTPRLHDVGSNNAFNVTHWKKRFEIEYGTQNQLFFQMVNAMLEQGQEVPVPDDVLDAIAKLDIPW